MPEAYPDAGDNFVMEHRVRILLRLSVEHNFSVVILTPANLIPCGEAWKLEVGNCSGRVYTITPSARPSDHSPEAF